MTCDSASRQHKFRDIDGRYFVTFAVTNWIDLFTRNHAFVVMTKEIIISSNIMMKNKTYSNGQKTFEQAGKEITYFFKNGKIKAKGISIDGIMEGEWKFYRETGQLWQVGNFNEGRKQGSWVRYDKKNKLEYQETFDRGKLVKK